MKGRIAIVAAGVAALLTVVIARIVHLTLTQSDHLQERAEAQHVGFFVVRAERGVILDRHGERLASTVDCPSLFVRPDALDPAPGLEPRLAAALGLPAATVAGKLASDRSFVWLKRTVTPRERAAVRELAAPGLGEEMEGRRFYPQGTTAAHVVGMAGVDLQGLEGIELRYDAELAAARQTLELEVDARRRPIFADGVTAPAVVRGATVELTLDVGLQTIAEEVLEEQVRASRALGGTVVVLDPWTGEILVLANVPTFDPNDRAAPLAARRNRAITDRYEPGSTFKALLAAAALEYGVVAPDDVIFCEEGRFRVGGRVVHDHHPQGWLSFAEVIQVSSNIGVAKVGARLGAERYHAFLQGLGFGSPTGVDLPGEVGGLLRAPTGWKTIDLATISFGHGVDVTPLQMTRAFAAIANGGLAMRPYVARRAVAADRTVLWERQPMVVRRVMRAATARAVTAMLERVVGEGGTGTRARVAGYRVAGKTGTAQKIDPATGRYSARGRIASFVGFLPADAPRLVILALLDEPQGTVYGGLVAAPVFQRVAAAAMTRLGVAPDPVAAPASELRQAVRAPAPRRARSASVAGVPSFIGQSLRTAVGRARELGWAVEVQGAGYVTSQTPPAGALVAPGKTLVLALGPAGEAGP